jgi:hypothetical protein
MSNSSRIERATREHVGAVLTSEQITELVKLSDPTSTKGVYPSDVAYKRTPEGLVCRGKTAYGDGILEFLAENSYRVLPTEQIVRRKPLIVKKEVAAPAAAKAAASTVPVPTVAASTGKKKAVKKTSKSASKPPVIAKQKGADRHAAI